MNFRDHWHPSESDAAEAALNNGGIISSIGYGFTVATTPPETENWRFRWINTQGMGNHGDLIASPKTPSARVVWLQGQFKFFREAGIHEEYLPAVVHSHLPRRHELAKILGETLRNPPLCRALCEWDGGGGKRFLAAWEITGISVPRLHSLAEIVRQTERNA